MNFKMLRNEVRTLSLIWLGLVAFNVFLSFSSVEDFFNEEPLVVAQSEVCASGQYYTKKSDKKRLSLFAFLSTGVSVQNDAPNVHGCFVYSDLFFKGFTESLFFEFSTVLTKNSFSQNSPRAPPVS